MPKYGFELNMLNLFSIRNEKSEVLIMSGVSNPVLTVWLNHPNSVFSKIDCACATVESKINIRKNFIGV